jgi:hypothetical protein
MKNDDALDLELLLHPARAYSHPREVLAETDLTTNEKRAILASWASDACAIEAAPALRTSPAGTPVTFDDIMDALRQLDDEARHGIRPPPHYRRVIGRGLLRGGRRSREGGGTPQQSAG